MNEDNLKLVREMYGAYQRGDTAAVAARCTPDVHWETVGRPSDFPTFGPRRGQVQVQDFFAGVSSELTFTEFTPLEFHSVGDKVFVLGRYAYKLRRSGREDSSDWVHVFTVQNGKVISFREFTDTARAAAAYRGGN